MRFDARLWLLAGLAGCHAQCSRPSDDRNEPNNDVAHATHLERDTPVSARSVEGDVDAWSFDAQAGEHLTISVTPFTMFGQVALIGPDGQTITDQRANTSEAGWTYDLDVTAPGTYTVTVMQGSAADNMFWFKWDYQIEVAARAGA